jgi:hypothetical protein
MIALGVETIDSVGICCGSCGLTASTDFFSFLFASTMTVFAFLKFLNENNLRKWKQINKRTTWEYFTLTSSAFFSIE